MSVRMMLGRKPANGGWSPLNLSPSVWFDPSDTSTITTSSGFVSALSDKSGNGMTAAQANSSLQPGYGTTTINGLNALDFTITGERRLETAASFSISQPYTIALVAQRSGTASSSGGVSFKTNGSWATTFMSLWHSNSNYLLNAGVNLISTRPNTSPHLHLWELNGTSSIIRVDGVTAVTGNAGTNGASNQSLWLGYAANVSAMVGVLGEVVVIPSLLSTSDRGDLETYLSSKWGITL